MTTNEADTNLAAQLLPREAYASLDWFEREQRELFGQSWVFAGLVDDLAEPGDYLTVDAGVHQLFVVRDRNRELRAFHNLCRHRGAQLVEGRSNLSRRVVCPYHSWSYELDGSLCGIPNEARMFPGIDKSPLGLLPAALGHAAGLVFVNPDAAPAEGFEQWWSTLPDPPWPPEEGVSGRVERDDTMCCYEMRANWKLFNENALDLDHLTHLHKNTLVAPPADEHRWDAAGRHYVCSRRPISDARLSRAGLTNPEPSVGARDAVDFIPCIWLLFPSTWIVALGNTFAIYQVVPVAVDDTQIRMRTWVRPDAPESLLTEMYPMPGAPPGTGSPEMPLSTRSIDCHPLKSGNFELEDCWALEGLQRNMRSSALRIGPLSPVGETPITFFQRNVLDFVSAG